MVKSTKSYAKKDSKKPDLATLNQWYQGAHEAARKIQWEWFVIDQYLRGNQSIKGNPQENSIEIVKKDNANTYPINKMYATFRAVRGFVTRHKPVVVVEPKNSSDGAKQYARRANATLERDNQLNNFRKINKEWVYYGVKYGIGYRQVGYDPVKKVCIRWSIDPNDLLSGSPIGEIEDAPYLIKNVVRTIGYLRDKYPTKEAEIHPDNLISDSEYKNLSMQIAFNTESLTGSLPENEQTAIVHECWYRTLDKNSKGGHVNICTFIDNAILDEQETEFDDYPFIPYKSDIVPNEFKGEGHMKHILSPQRMFNLLNTQMLEYNHISNRGRYVTEKNSGFSVMTTKEGQIIRVNPGKRLQPLNPPTLSPLIDSQMQIADQAIQLIGGINDASSGKLPSASLSGDAIELLQQGDSNNISDLRDNFEDALALEAQWILKMYSLYEVEGIPMQNQVSDEEEDRFAVYGASAVERAGVKVPNKYYIEDTQDYIDVATILTDNNVKVSVTSQLGETKAARMELMMRLVDLGMPLKVLLEHLEFPNTSDILERMASESVAEVQMQMMQQQPPMGAMPPEGMAPPVEGGAPPPPPDEGVGDLRAQIEEQLASLNEDI